PSHPLPRQNSKRRLQRLRPLWLASFSTYHRAAIWCPLSDADRYPPRGARRCDVANGGKAACDLLGRAASLDGGGSTGCWDWPQITVLNAAKGPVQRVRVAPLACNTSISHALDTCGCATRRAVGGGPTSSSRRPDCTSGPAIRSHLPAKRRVGWH